MGIGSGGSHTGASITLTNRIFSPQTEEEFMAECVEHLLEGSPTTTEVNVTAATTF